MSDSESPERGSPRSSTVLNRPQIGPLGPRTRLSSFRTSSFTTDQSGSSQTSTETLAPPTMQSATNSKPLPNPTTQSKPLPTPSASSLDRSSGPSTGAPELEELAGHTGAAAGLPLPALPDSPPSKYLPSVREDTEEATAPAYTDTPPDSETSSQISSRVTATPRPTKVTSVVQAPPKLTPPPAVNFDVVPVPWKGMPLEPALWTFNSTELQDIVSRSIRASAKESFLRLLTVENLDKVLPAELVRLEEAKTSTQARYRFLIHRRTMLFHALNSSYLQKSQKGEDDDLLVSRLTTQLAETIGDCDQRLEELLQINDQIAQINKLIDVHSSSALAIALRKLNASYSRRTRDLNKARERIFQLESELEDAWKEAEKLAKELDDYEDSIGADDSTAIIEKAEIVPVPRSPSKSPPPHGAVFERRSSTPMPMTPTLLSVKNVSVFLPTPVVTTSQATSVSASPMNSFVFPLPVPKTEANDDTASIKSSKSFRSTKSNKSGKTFASSIQAAKKRSSRASQSSLRLSLSNNHGKALSDDMPPPPMPEIPVQFMNAICSPGFKNSGKGTKHSFPESIATSAPANADSTAFRIENEHGRPMSISSLPVQLHGGMRQRKASFDTMVTSWTRSDAAVEAYKGKSADDIYVGAGHKHLNHPSASLPKSPYSKENIPVSLNWDDNNEITVVSRSPPYRSKALAQEHRHLQASVDDVPPVPPPKDPLRSIPSIWKSIEPMRHASHPLPLASSLRDLPSLPESNSIPPYSSSQKAAPGTLGGKANLLRHSKTLHKIRGLTKRYSASIPPLFNGKTSMRRPA